MAAVNYTTPLSVIPPACDDLVGQPAWEDAMKRYVGLDVSQATTAICVVDGEGLTLAESVTATEPCAIAAFVRRRAPSIERIGMEMGPLSVWLWNELRALELPVVCMDARHANAGLKVMLAKTDRNDLGVPTR